MQLRRKILMQNQESGGLPSGFMQIDWIEGNGTQWLDTGVIPTEQTVSKFKVMSKQNSGNVVFGFYVNERNSYRFFNPSATYLDLPTNNSDYRLNSGIITLVTNMELEVEIGNFYYIISGNKVEKNPVTFAQPTKAITLNYYSDNSISKNRWYWLKMYEGQQIIRDMIPCIRTADSKPGMYDLVGKTFYTNAGTGEFIIPT